MNKQKNLPVSTPTSIILGVECRKFIKKKKNQKPRHVPVPITLFSANIGVVGEYAQNLLISFDRINN